MATPPAGRDAAAAGPADPDTTDRIRESYEVLPYRGGAHYASHPDCLATVATLHGLAPADVERCRVLELGCATGGNLLPMAASLPGSEFVGVDLAPGQIAAAREVADAVGLPNVTLMAADLRDLDDRLGTFDYVLCHGVYSWVPEDVRRRLLERTRALLAPDGLAMVSFNTWPGSQPRDSVRGLFRFALEEVLAPGDPVEAARSLLRILPAAFEGVDASFVKQLGAIAEECDGEPGYYLGHEYLADVNQPFFLWEFAAAAREAGLRWTADAWIHDDGSDLPAGAQATVERLSPSRLARDQWIDLLTDRAFRRGILCRDEREPDDAMDAERVLGLRASAGAWPDDGGGRRESGEEGSLSFSSWTHQVSTNIPIVTAALRILWEAWPESTPVTSLWRRARDEAREAGARADAPDDATFFAGAMLQCYRRHVVGLHVHRFPATRRVGERPGTSALARYQAGRGPDVTTLVHQAAVLDAFDRAVLGLLDGTRTPGEVVEALAGEDGDEKARRVERSLEMLGRAGLLLAPQAGGIDGGSSRVAGRPGVADGAG